MRLCQKIFFLSSNATVPVFNQVNNQYASQYGYQPKLIVYDKKGKFVKEFQGDIQIEEVWKAMGKK
jgi:hypothetical protein